MANWDERMQIGAFGHTDEVAFTNEWGRNYPSWVDELMPSLLGIGPNETVVDVGGGHCPFARANLNIDAFVDDNTHRSGVAANRKIPLVAGLGERLPLRDGSVDVLLSRQTMEHIPHPDEAAREMSRVARRGFVETPSPVYESSLGFAPHLWLVTLEDDTLVFRRKPWVRHPLASALRPFWWFNRPIRYDLELKYRNTFMTQYEWEGEMRVRVLDDPAAPDLTDPQTLALAQMDHELNGLSRSRPPVEEVRSGVEMALQTMPEWALVHNTRGVMLWMEGKRDEALAAFKRAAELEPSVPEYVENSRLNPDAKAEPLLVQLPEEQLPAYPDLTALCNELRIDANTSVLEITHQSPWYAKSDVASFEPDGSLNAPRDRYDVVIARDGLADALNLAATFDRLEHIAGRGYVELPSRTIAALQSLPGQKWFAENRMKGVVAWQRPSGGSSCRHILAGLQATDPLIAKRIADNVYGIARVGKVWDGKVGIPIRRFASTYDPSEPAQRATAESSFRVSMQDMGVRVVRDERFPISVIVHTRNEERDIEDCLKTVHGWADEIIVMDMESTDRTREIAARYTDRVLLHPYVRVCEPARNAALDAAKHDWALYLDADERLTPKMAGIIEKIIREHGNDVAAVRLPYKNVVFGKWIQHTGGWWPGYKAPMLVKRDKVRFNPEIHSMPDVDGEVVCWQPHDEQEAIEHLSYKSLHDWAEKANRYTDLETERAIAAGESPDWRGAAQVLGGTLYRYYDETGGKKDGTEGWLLSLSAGIYRLLQQMKLAEGLKDSASFDAERWMPPSAAEFLALAAQAASGTDAVARNEPDWIVPLINMLQPGLTVGHFLDSPGAKDKAGRIGWNTEPERLERADAIVVWRFEKLQSEQLTQLVSRAKPGALFVLGFPSDTNAKELRSKLETLFDATVHLLDPEPDCGRLVAFLWNRERIDIERRVLVTVHSNALRMMGGGEAVVFEMLVRATREFGVRADVTVSLRLDPEEYDAVHVVSLYQPDHAQAIRSWNKPTMVMPVWWDGPRVRWVTSVLPAILSPERSDAEREELLSCFARRELAANGQSIEEACDEASTIQALTAVRDCGARVVATGSQEIAEMERALGETPIPTGSIHLGIDAELFDKATAEPFVEKFGLRDFVLCVGRVEPMKNQLMLAYALRGTGKKLVLMGSAPDPSYLGLCQHWGGDDLLYIPSQPPEMVASACKAAACHVLPSWWEVPGLVSLEAAAAGCPVVVTDCGTIRHYVGDSAHYCDPADPRSIREAVEAACKEQGSQTVRELRARCLTTFTVARCAASYRSAYDALLEGGKVKLLVVPDWRRPDTWQPVLDAFLRQYRPVDGVCLSLLVDAPTDTGAWAAQNLLMDYCESKRINLDKCADVELADLASVGEVAGILESGSLAERQLCGEMEITPLDWREAWEMPQAA